METKREAEIVKNARRKYDAEFKKEVIKMVETGRQVPDLASSLGIGASLIYQWLRQSKRGHASVEGSSFDNERASLYKQIRELEMERDIKKKSLGHSQPSEIERVYEFIHSEEGNFPCKSLCTILSVSRSGYYAWRKRKTHQHKDNTQKIEQKIMDTFSHHKNRYGSRRIPKSSFKRREKK